MTNVLLVEQTSLVALASSIFIQDVVVRPSKKVQDDHDFRLRTSDDGSEDACGEANPSQKARPRIGYECTWVLQWKWRLLWLCERHVSSVVLRSVGFLPQEAQW